MPVQILSTVAAAAMAAAMGTAWWHQARFDAARLSDWWIMRQDARTA